MKQVSRIVFFTLLGELIVGGGGRLIAFGPVSLRMILFAFAMIITIIEFARGKRMPVEFNRFLLLFLASILLALALGVASRAQPTFWVEDIKPLLYVLILPFFYFVLSDVENTKPIPYFIIAGALGMAVAFVLVLVLIHSGLMPFLFFYHNVIGTGEFFFRAETTFFYKGFIYFCIALIFTFFVDKKYRTVLLIALSLSIILTFTRGFVFALAMTAMFYAVMERKYVNVFISAFALVLVLFLAKPAIYQASSMLHSVKGYDEQVVAKDRLLGNREESDAGRMDQLKQVLERVTPSSFFIGHGFGNGVPARPVHMEISYLEIFHKQGVMGLCVWGYFIFLLLKSFKASHQNQHAKAYFYSTCFLFFQSITNQFINNPIGLSFALLSLTWLHIAKWEQTKTGEGIRHQKGAEIPITNF